MTVGREVLSEPQFPLLYSKTLGSQLCEFLGVGQLLRLIQGTLSLLSTCSSLWRAKAGGSPRGTLLSLTSALYLWQVSCSGDQVQLVLSVGWGGEELLLTLWERGQTGASYTLGILQSHNCPPAAHRHLHQALCLLQSF